MVISDHYLKSILAIQFKLGVFTCWGGGGGGGASVHKWFAFGQHWPNFGPLEAKNYFKVGQNSAFRPFSEKIFTRSNSNLVCILSWYAFGLRLPNFSPLVATKWLKMAVSGLYLKHYSHNPMQTWCVHLFGECSELIFFWATLARYWPSSDPKWLKLVIFDCYPKSIHAIKHIVYTCWVSFQNWLAYGPRWSNFDPLVAKN